MTGGYLNWERLFTEQYPVDRGLQLLREGDQLTARESALSVHHPRQGGSIHRDSAGEFVLRGTWVDLFPSLQETGT
ncbi:hypothetical protein ASF89_00660 [Frigoribacterium sp. Leaf172]|nr:hypothetical protein ASF89_00660 [Frigoribacterium sp. Leaf172]